MAISGGQVRQARAQVRMTTAEFAEEVGVAKTTIVTAENDGYISQKTSDKIEKAVNALGFEFIDNGGMRKIAGTRILRGTDGLIQFYDDLYNTIRKTGGDIYLRNAPDHLFMKWIEIMEFSESHMSRMKELDNYHFKILIEEGDTDTISTEYATYRWIPKEFHGSLPIYGYANKVALLNLHKNPVIHLIDDKFISSGFKKEFDMLWGKSIEIN